MITPWVEPLFCLRSLRVVKGDVAAGIAWYIEQTGKTPAMVVLNAENKAFAHEAGDIPVSYRGGTSRGEVWLCDSTDDLVWINRELGAETTARVPGLGSVIMATLESPKTTVAIIKSRTPNNRRGPKHRDIPVDRILALHADGLGSKVIARVLAEAGTVVSFRTVARVLAGER